MSTCRSCGAPIQWAKTAMGKAMPLDAEPSPNGNVHLHGDVAVVLVADDIGRVRATGARLYLSHFVTCPDAQKWRR
ncbi:MAG: hypothetical protein ACRDQD_04190 [Nocardioidaceae bacterium]